MMVVMMMAAVAVVVVRLVVIVGRLLMVAVAVVGIMVLGSNPHACSSNVHSPSHISSSEAEAWMPDTIPRQISQSRSPALCMAYGGRGSAFPPLAGFPACRHFKVASECSYHHNCLPSGHHAPPRRRQEKGTALGEVLLLEDKWLYWLPLTQAQREALHSTQAA